MADKKFNAQAWFEDRMSPAVKNINDAANDPRINPTAEMVRIMAIHLLNIETGIVLMNNQLERLIKLQEKNRRKRK